MAHTGKVKIPALYSILSSSCAPFSVSKGGRLKKENKKIMRRKRQKDDCML